MICPQCNKEFIRISNSQKYCSKECVKVKATEYDKEYRQSEIGKELKRRANKKYSQTYKGKESTKRYRQSESGKEAKKKYSQTDKSKEQRLRYRQSERGKEVKKKNYQTDKAKETAKKYIQSKRGKEVKKKADKKYSQTERGKEVIKKIGKKNLIFFQTNEGKLIRKIAQTKYGQSKAGQKKKKEYRQSERGKELKRKSSQTDKAKSTTNANKRRRRKSDPLFKLIDNVRGRLGVFLRASKIRKTNRTFTMVGCTPEFLKEYLEKKFKPGMTWKNHGKYGWHIDHKLPMSLAMTPEDVEELMHYTNLQPMWATENIKKGNKII